MLLLCVATIWGLYLVKTLWQWNQMLKCLKQIFPMVPGLPIIGVAHMFLNEEKGLGNGLRFMKDSNYKSFVALLGPKPFLIVSDPQLAEVILSSNSLIDKGSDYKFLRNWFGDSLLMSTGVKWRNKRKILTPSFHYKILEDFVRVFDEKSKILVKQLKRESDGIPFDIYNYMSLCTLDIICETAMGTPMNCQENPDLMEFVVSNKNLGDMMYKRMFGLLRFDCFYLLSKWRRIEKEAIRVLRNHSRAVIESRRSLLEENFDDENEVDNFGVKRRQSFLDVLLKSTIDGEPMTDLEISEEVDTFMFEGHDTTAKGISFALYLLSQYQDIQQKVYDEILNVIGPDNTTATDYGQMQNLKYTEMVIKECLRLFPSVAAFGRYLSRDVPFDNKIIPKGLDVVIQVFNLHHNKEVFPDPEKFDPERFNSENSLNRHPYAYLPFSAGPRNCIGQKFAMLEMKSTISKILRFYEIQPVSGFKVNPTSKVTIESTNGIKIKLIKRGKIV